MSRPYSDKLARFLRNHLLIENREGPCIKFTLKHNSKAANVVSNYNIGDSQIIDADFIEGLQRHIETDAFGDSEGLAGGLQKYQLLAYHQASPDEHQGRQSFTEGDPTTDEDAFDSEPKNEKGLVSQLMRHNEALMRSAVVSQNNMNATLVNQIEKLQTEKEKLIDDRFRNFSLYEELMSAAHERKQLTQRAEFDETMKREMFQKLMLMAPMALKMLGGHKQLPGETRPIDMMLKQFAESLTQEQFSVLMTTLKPEQQAVLAMLMQETQKEETAVNSQKKETSIAKSDTKEN